MGLLLLELPHELLERVMRFLAVRDLAIVARASREVKVLVDEFGARTLQQLCAAANNRRSLLIGAGTIYRLGRFCGRRALVPIKFYRQCLAVLEQYQSYVAFDIAAVELLVLVVGDLFHAMYTRPDDEMEHAIGLEPRSQSYADYRNLLEALIEASVKYYLLNTGRSRMHPPSCQHITFNDMELALAQQARLMEPRNAVLRLINRAGEDDDDEDPDYVPILDEDDEDDVPDGIEVTTQPSLFEYYEDAEAYFFDHSPYDWQCTRDSEPEDFGGCGNEFCCHCECNCRLAEWLFVRAYEDAWVLAEEAEQVPTWYERKKSPHRPLWAWKLTRSDNMLRRAGPYNFYNYSSSSDFDHAAAVSQMAHDLARGDRVTYGHGRGCPCPGVRGCRKQLLRFAAWRRSSLANPQAALATEAQELGLYVREGVPVCEWAGW